MEIMASLMGANESFLARHRHPKCVLPVSVLKSISKLSGLGMRERVLSIGPSKGTCCNHSRFVAIKG
jgi:hypothetical protein